MCFVTLAEARSVRACAIESADDLFGVKRPDNAHAVRPEQDKEQ
jgi:hypothetical protein